MVNLEQRIVSDLQNFNGPVLIWPIALVGFVVVFFWAYRKGFRVSLDAKKRMRRRITQPERPRLSLLGRPSWQF